MQGDCAIGPSPFMCCVKWRPMIRYWGWAVAGLFVVFSPNLLWLGTSTLKIHNDSRAPIDSIAYQACGTLHAVGKLPSHEFTFRFLPVCGDDTLEIMIGQGKFCQTYIEGELYHVDAVISSVDTVSCTYDDVFSSLLVEKMLW